MSNQQWGGQGQGGGYGGQAQARPGVFVPQQNSNSNGAQPMGLGGVMNDPFLGSMAGNLLQQQGQSYYTYMQSKVGGVLSGGGGTMAYLFAVTPEYVFQKISMLLVPFLRTWTYVRQPDPGPHKWEPAATDTNAPDLYIGVTALWTYCLLVGVSVFKSEAFSPEVIISTVSSSVGAWLFHTVVLKGILWSLGVGGVGLLELSSYAGYSFVYGCFILLGRLASSTLGHAIWAYSGFAYALFLVRTVKSIVRADPKYHYGTYWKNELRGEGEGEGEDPCCSLASSVRPPHLTRAARALRSFARWAVVPELHAVGPRRVRVPPPRVLQLDFYTEVMLLFARPLAAALLWRGFASPRQALQLCLFPFGVDVHQEGVSREPRLGVVAGDAGADERPPQYLPSWRTNEREWVRG